MPKTASTFPVRRGRWVLLKVVAGEGNDAVYLAASPEATQPQVIKAMPVAPETGRIPGTSREERQILARMRFAHLAAVIASPEVEGDGGFVMEYVAGRSLAAISRRAEDYSVLLPPELGLVVAHDAFAAAEFFHAFEGGGRVHGNITARTILVAYSGEVKAAGYRPGFHPPAGIDAHVTEDLKPLANVLSELAFEKFPQELAVLVPRLLEDRVTPEESMAAVRAFLHAYQPSLDQRRTVAAWLADVFLGEREAEAQEEARLLAAGAQLLGPRRRVAKPASWVGGTALLALVGGLSLMAHRQAAEPRAMANRAEPVPAVVREPPPAVDQPMAEPSPPVVAAPAPAAGAPAAAAPSATVLAPGPSSLSHPAVPSPRRGATGAAAGRLLREADAAFVAGNRIEAVNLALQAVRAGGGVRAHLALGEYYRSMLRYQDAMNHYRAVVAIEPDNKLGLAGVRLLEKKVSACPACR